MVSAGVQEIKLMYLASDSVKFSVEIFDRGSITLLEFIRQKSCYNGGFADPGAAKHDEAIAIARRWLAGVLLRGGRSGTRANGDGKDAIFRAGRPFQFGARLRSAPATIDPLLGLVDRVTASARPLHAAKKSAARLQLRNVDRA